MQTDELNRHFAADYIAQLKNRETTHNRAMLSFCGAPGSGKTTLAKKLARDLKAQYIMHDDIRAMVRHEGYDPSKMVMGAISSIVTDEIMAHDANKFVIVDAGQDRQWKRFFEHAKEWKAKPIIIRLNVPEKILRKRLIEREGVESGHVARLKTFIEQFEHCKKFVKADIELPVEYDYEAVKARIAMLIS